MNNLIILGAGGHGRFVKEIAEAMKIYSKVNFLDDDFKCEIAIGICSDFEKYISEHNHVFPAFGDNMLRISWIEKIEKNHFKVPILIHPTAYISPSAVLYPGTVVGPKTAINTNTVIEKGTIISIGSIIDHDVFIGSGCHIDCGAIVKSNCIIKPKTKVESGAVVRR